MRPEQQAEALITAWITAMDGERPNVLGGELADPDTDRLMRDVADTIRAAIRAAVLEEREACAQAAEDWALGWRGPREELWCHIAEAIRTRR